jgi:hypothetical protein
MPVQQAPQVGGLRIAGTVERPWRDMRGRHDGKRSKPVIVYMLSLERANTFCQRRAASPARNC